MKPKTGEAIRGGFAILGMTSTAITMLLLIAQYWPPILTEIATNPRISTFESTGISLLTTFALIVGMIRISFASFDVFWDIDKITRDFLKPRGSENGNP